MFKSLSLAILGLIVLCAATASAQVPTEFWTKRLTRVLTQARDAQGQVYPVRDQPAMIWMDTPAFRDKLETALAMADRAPGLTPDEVGRMNYVIKSLGRPDIRKNTDHNGNVMFDGAKMQQKVFVVVVNFAPLPQGGGVYVGEKPAFVMHAITQPVGFDGLVQSLASF